MNSLRAQLLRDYDASQRSRVGAGMNRSAKCKLLLFAVFVRNFVYRTSTQSTRLQMILHCWEGTGGGLVACLGESV